jgi:hypothetical protein
MSALNEVSETLRSAVDYYQRGILSLALLWDQLAETLAPFGSAAQLNCLAPAQQMVLRRAYGQRPLSLRMPGRDSALRQQIERWCQAEPTEAVSAAQQSRSDRPRTLPSPTAREVAAPVPAVPEGPAAQFAQFYREHGYVRRPRGGVGQARDWEIRFVFQRTSQMKPLQRLLGEMGFQPGPGYRRYGFLMLPLRGRQSVQRLLALVRVSSQGDVARA